MLLSISGLNSNLGLKLVDDTRTQQLSQMRSMPQNQRAVEAFVSGIGSITTPRELTENFEVYSFVMRAFDLEDQIFGRGLMRKLLESDSDDPGALVNRLTDPRFRVLHDALGFLKPTNERPDFSSEVWQASIIDLYFNQKFENKTDTENSTIGTVLKFRREAPSITSWFQVLRDKDLSEFFRTSLGLPSQLSSLDIDKQRDLLSEKFDLKSLANPETLDRLINRYLAISDTLNPQAAVSSPAISLLRNSSELGVIVSLSVPQVSISASALFR